MHLHKLGNLGGGIRGAFLLCVYTYMFHFYLHTGSPVSQNGYLFKKITFMDV